MRERECPNCGAWMYHTQAEPDVGIEGGWCCVECEHVELDELPQTEPDE